MQSVTIWYEPTFRWAQNGRHIFYIRDDHGDENWVLYSLDTTTGESRRLTPAEGVRVRGLQTSAKYPDEVLFGMNDREPTQVDYYRANAMTGKVTHVGTAAPYLLKLWDHDFRERVAVALLPDLSIQTLTPTADGGWKEMNRTARVDTPSMSANLINDLGGAVFSGDGKRLLSFSSKDLDTTALVEYDLASGARRVVAVEKGVDIKRALVNPATYPPLHAARMGRARSAGRARLRAPAVARLRRAAHRQPVARRPDLDRELHARGLARALFSLRSRHARDRGARRLLATARGAQALRHDPGRDEV
jgi:hypothetical protein